MSLCLSNAGNLAKKIYVYLAGLHESPLVLRVHFRNTWSRITQTLFRDYVIQSDPHAFHKLCKAQLMLLGLPRCIATRGQKMFACERTADRNL